MSEVSNKEALRDKIHEIHNFLRNNGAGYGMNALKVFNIVYGLKKIEENGLLDKVNLKRPECEFSYLLHLAHEEEGEKLAQLIFSDVLDSISTSELRELLFYEIPKNIRGSVFVYLFKEIDKITVIEQTCNVLLSGKIYEYFIGRDESAISELGAYFTDRHIVEYVLGKLDPSLDADGTVPTMVDMFGGSGGFTTGYIDFLNRKYPHQIDWFHELRKVSHFDMNEDVIKSAGLEFFCLTGVLPDMNNLKYKNSFTDEFNDQKFTYPLTNPPYGGDRTRKSDSKTKNEKIKEYIKKELETLEDEAIRKRRQSQLKVIEQRIKLEKQENEKAKVCVSSCSARIQTFALEHGLTGNDKESCSLMLLMDMLAPGGTAIGVLKEGVFSNKSYKELRKCLVEKYCVREVISVPQDQFENTSTKTSIVIFDHQSTEPHPNQLVVFRDLVVEKCSEDVFDEVDGHIVLLESVGDIIGIQDTLVAEASIEQIVAHPVCSLSGKEYTKREIVAGDGFVLKKLGDMAKLENGKQLDKKNIVEGTYPVYGGGLAPVGFHDSFNSENCTIVAGTGNCGFVQFDSGKFWASQCFTIKSSNEELNNYLFVICKALEHVFKESQGGSVQKFIRANQFKEMLIPVPVCNRTMQEWVEKISGPYCERNAKLSQIAALESCVQLRIKQLAETEPCDDHGFDEVCSTKKGKQLSKDKFKSGPYPVIGGGVKPAGYHNEYNFEKNTILCSASGTAGHISRYGTPIWASDCFAIFPQDGVVTNDYLYYTLLAQQEEILALKRGSAQPHVYAADLSTKLRIKVPKDKERMQELEPLFQEIDALQQDVKRANEQFLHQLSALRTQSIVSAKDELPVEEEVPVVPEKKKRIVKVKKAT